MLNIAVFASGHGTNFSAIIKAVKKGVIRANLSLLVTDNPRAGAIRRAQNSRVRVALVERNDFPGKEAFEERIIRHLRENRIDLIVLAGFMRILSPGFVRRYKHKIVNIHPALLPSFKGAHGIADAFLYGAKVTGVTVHFVDDKMDHGPIILQAPVIVKENDTLRSLEERIHKVEHQLYPQAIRLCIEGRLRFKGRKVLIAASQGKRTP